MARKYKVTALILIMCMSILTVFPDQVMAQDGEISEVDELAEEPLSIEEEDPGQGRLTGDVPEEFFGDSGEVRAMSVGVTHDSRFAEYDKILGIDVSKWNKTINWSKVKAAGVEFAFVRVGFRGYETGGLGSDEYAADNMKNAAAAGVKVGAYIFSQAITTKEAIEEADYVLQKVKGYDITMPLVFDFEYYSGGRLEKANLSRRKQTDICLAFCERIEAAGYTPLVYANKSMLSSDLYAEEISAKYPIWLAHYTSKTNYTGDYSYWQYSSSGSVNGISGNVDMNYWYAEPGTSTVLSKPGSTKLSGKATSYNTIKLSWNKVSDATGYRLYYYNSTTKSYSKLKDITSVQTTSYVDSGKKANTTYKYKIKAYKKKDGQTVFGTASSAVSVTTPMNQTGKTNGTNINVRKGPSTSKAKLTVLPINTGVTITGISGDWYRVSLKVNGKTCTGYILKKYVTIIKKPTLTVSAISGSKIKLTWNKISGASGYQIQRYNSSKNKYETIKTIKSGSTVSYTNSGLKGNTTYKYRIRSYKVVRGRNIYSYYCSGKSAKTL
ncbi:MAG: GH25 family lysozyme [Lachnospiraceae bacterium]